MRESAAIRQLRPCAKHAVELLLDSLDRRRGHKKRLSAKSADVFFHLAVTTTMRLMFLVMAEQRGLLSRAAQRDHRETAVSTILRHFRGLCDRTIGLPVPMNDSALLEVLQSLQQVESRIDTKSMNFPSLDIDHLGEVYESLLDYTAEREECAPIGSQKGRLRVARGSGKRSKGAHYTPRSLAKTTVEHALARLVYHGAAEDKPPSKWKLRTAKEILDLRICDVSCGCGAFLIQACRYLADRLVEAWNVSGMSATTRARRLVAESCLYGVDKDRDAVEVAKYSLWLLAEATCDPGAFLEHRVRCGDSLIDGNGDGIEVERPFDWRLEFPDVFGDRCGFDAIIGNPPYVSLYARESQSASFADHFDVYARRHFGQLDGAAVISGRVNTYLLFLVRSIQLLNAERGIAALVLPDTILTNQSYEPMRRILTENARLIKAVRYQGRMFRSAAVGTAVVVCGPRGSHRHVTLVDQQVANAATSIIREPCEVIASRPSCSWLPQETSHIARVTLPIKGTIPIGEFAFVKDGINPGSRRTREWLLTDEPDGDPSLRLCMEGNWIEPFRITRKRLWVRYDTSRLTLEERKAGASLREPWIFDSPKIVYRQTAPHITAAIDHEGLCARNSVHSIVLKEHNETVLYALMAFLNSEVFRDYYQSFTGETRKTFPQVHIASVKQLRVPEQILDPSHLDTKRLAQLAASVSSTSDNNGLSHKSPNTRALKQMNARVARIVASLAPPALGLGAGDWGLGKRARTA